MKEITSYRETSENVNGTSVKEGIHKPCSQKKMILAYFKKYSDEYTVVTRAAVDHLTGKNIASESARSYYDGVYAWTNEEVYLFEKYDLKLNGDFIDYVLNKTK